MKSQQPAGNMHSETLDYIRSMLGQLRMMAEAERCDMLAYLIEMAFIVARDIGRGERPARVVDDPLRKGVHERDTTA